MIAIVGIHYYYNYILYRSCLLIYGIVSLDRYHVYFLITW